MTKTALEIQTEALRHIGVADIEDTPDSADISRADNHLTGIYDMLSDTEELAMDWPLSAVPDALFLPLSIMLAGSLASAYSKPEYIPEFSRGKSMIRDYEITKTKVDGRTIKATYF